MNRYVHEDESPIPILKIDEALEQKQTSGSPQSARA